MRMYQMEGHFKGFPKLKIYHSCRIQRRKNLLSNGKFPVSRIVPKNVKGGTLWDFLNIQSVAKYQTLMGGTIKKSEKNRSHSAEKRRKV